MSIVHVTTENTKVNAEDRKAIDQKYRELIGRLVEDCRHNMGLTQNDLAKKVGRNKDYIGKIERGKRLPSISLLMEILSVTKENLMSFVVRLPEFQEYIGELRELAEITAGYTTGQLKTLKEVARVLGTHHIDDSIYDCDDINKD